MQKSQRCHADIDLFKFIYSVILKLKEFEGGNSVETSNGDLIMAHAITPSTHLGATTRTSGDGLVRRAFARLISARERQVRRYVNGYLLSLDDATLAAHGYDRNELSREGSAVAPF